MTANNNPQSFVNKEYVAFNVKFSVTTNVLQKNSNNHDEYNNHSLNAERLNIDQKINNRAYKSCAKSHHSEIQQQSQSQRLNNDWSKVNNVFSIYPSNDHKYDSNKLNKNKINGIIKDQAQRPYINIKRRTTKKIKKVKSESPREQYECPYCNAKFMRWTGIKRHVTKKRCNKLNRNDFEQIKVKYIKNDKLIKHLCKIGKRQ